MKSVRLDVRAFEAMVGQLDETLRLIENRFRVQLAARGGEVSVSGQGEDAGEREERVADLLLQLEDLHARGIALGRDDFRTALGLLEREPGARLVDHFVDSRIKASDKKTVVAKSANQRRYIEAIRENDLVFGIGPAGTGKTYLAVAMAVLMLNEKRVKRIILARPAVEAGERLGFLPGDIAAKVDPYLRPLFDALYDMLEPEKVNQHLDRGVIEVAPLAFMRGRTLNDSFIILDEAQNTSPEQIKMFLTRLGFNSKMVVTGDITQIDLPRDQRSGLVMIGEILEDVEGIEFVRFGGEDVVRHKLVQRIVAAYNEYAEQQAPALREAQARRQQG